MRLAGEAAPGDVILVRPFPSTRFGAVAVVWRLIVGIGLSLADPGLDQESAEGVIMIE